MRVAISLVVLALAGCGNSTRSLDNELREARDLLRAEHNAPALAKAEDGLRRAGESRNAVLAWKFRLLKAEILLAQGKPAAAVEAIGHDPPGGPKFAEARGRVLLLRGQAAYLLSRYADAQDLLGRAAEAARQLGSESLAAEVDFRQGALLRRQSRFAEAEAALGRAIAGFGRLHDAYLEAAAAGNLGVTLQAESRNDEAIVWFEKVRDLFRKLGAAESVARANGNLGTCYLRLGELDEARARFEQALAVFAQTGNLREQQAWTGNAGNVLLEKGDYAGAAQAFQRALDLARQVPADDWSARWLNNLAETSIELGNWDAAESQNQEALALKRKIGDKLFEASSLGNAGRIAVGRGRFAEAEKLFRAASEAPAEDPRVTLDAHAGLADLYVRTGRRGKADAEFRAAVASIDRLSASLLKDDYKFAYLSSLIRFYRQYVDFLMSSGQPERALEIAESSRSRVLAARSGRPDALAQRPAANYRQLSRQADSVLMEYWLGHDRSYLWVVTPARIGHYVLPGQAALGSLLANYSGAVMGQRNPLEAAAESGHRLYQALLAPAAESGATAHRYIIVPDADLYSLNFESLPAGGAGNRYWIEDATISLAPSLDYLVENSRSARRQAPAGLLLIGDPAPALEQYPRLEFAAQEVDSIASAMARVPQRVLRGPAASPEAYHGAQPGGFGFIHFAAHATANQKSPLDSAVVLSGAPENCRLFARDVMSVPLGAELVTISACRGAGARTYAGEGLVGFAWAFLRAGARGVVAGLWDVNDRSTAQLMARLYGQLAGGASPADALRASKLAMIRSGGAYAKPYYWAPFQLYTSVP